MGSPMPCLRTASGIACFLRARGADGDRTHDLRLAKPALSQLSYSPGTVRSALTADVGGGQAPGTTRGPSSLPSHHPPAFTRRPRLVSVLMLPPFACPETSGEALIVVDRQGIKRSTPGASPSGPR